MQLDKIIGVIIAIGIMLHFLILPITGEVCWTKYNKTKNIKFLKNALRYDSDNTTYNYHAAFHYLIKNPYLAKGYIEKVEVQYNGDIVQWAIPMLKARHEAKRGHAEWTKNHLWEAVYLWPNHKQANETLFKIKQMEEKKK